MKKYWLGLGEIESLAKHVLLLTQRAVRESLVVSYRILNLDTLESCCLVPGIFIYKHRHIDGSVFPDMTRVDL